ncbi:hypothetical protein RHMOL_Rhmol08G0315800 [Rhododendron molle]|uniref:Uncharacterized protein n=1 Tax=Rhododendron molle TaxID=49168 RepID=A0ACC0MUH4_RHOML|nr:hypothetical protein RHMOL_Rhmol08G0315800 [Rhododendron molle]
MEPVSDLEPGRDLVVYTYKSLKSFTKGFSPENYVGDTQYGKLYRGQIQKGLETLGVIVKIWGNEFTSFATTAEHQLSRWQNEIKLMTESDVRSHPNVAKLIGFCSENGRLGVVYELQPVDSLWSLIRKDDFKWIARIKVALGFARLLESLHDQGLWLHNISSAHLMVEQNFNPRLVDFSMLVGGVFGETHHDYEVGSAGHVDPRSPGGGLKSDQFFDAHDGVEITKLAMRCVDRRPEQRPTMKEVVCCLQKRKVVNSIGDVIGREEHP